MSVPTISLRGVAFAYPDGRRALDGVDLHIHPGERVALLGPNGAGKTTLVLHLNGILLPQQGTVEVAGIPVTKEHFVEVRRRVGIVFQDPDDQVFMPTVHEDVAFGPANLGLRGAELEARVEAALDGGGHAGAPPPGPPPPVVRRTPPGGHRHRARHGAGDPGARRALGQSGPGRAGASWPGCCAAWASPCSW